MGIIKDSIDLDAAIMSLVAAATASGYIARSRISSAINPPPKLSG